jgi:hypothetical protein
MSSVHQDFRGRDGLTYMTLRVIRNMHEKSTQRCGQLFCADKSSFCQFTKRKFPNPLSRRCERRRKLRE